MENTPHNAPEPYILIVDDDWMSRELLETVLTTAGYTVRVVNSGERALAVACSDPPTVVLLDVRLSGVDGYEVCRRLAGDPCTAKVPVVMLTAYNTDEDRAQASAAGAAAFLEKPYDTAKLLATVELLLRQM